jgi:hypothetical protein
MAFSNIGNPPQLAFAAQSAINSAGVLDNGIARAYHTLVVQSGASVSAGVVAIELSNDGTNWYAPASNSVTTSAQNTTYSVTVGPLAFEYVRARISTAITGGTVTATLASA